MVRRTGREYVPVEERMGDVQKKLDECLRFNQTQAVINLKHAENAKLCARELRLLFLAAHAPTKKERRGARSELEIVRAQLDGPAPEMAVAVDEDARRREFSALVVLACVACGFVIVAGLFTWWCCS